MGILSVPSYRNKSTFRTSHRFKYYMMPSPLSLLIILASTITYTEASPVFGPDRIYYSKHHDISAFTSRNSKGIAETQRAAPRSADIGDVVDVAVGAGSFSTLVKIVTDLDLVPTLRGVDAVTIFAPSDDAFAKLPAGTLESLTLEQKKAIVSRHVVAGACSFNTLVKIVGDLGLVPTLKGVDAVTIFAPSDEAFAKLPEGTLESLTTEQAKAIVSRHVVAGAT